MKSKGISTKNGECWPKVDGQTTDFWSKQIHHVNQDWNDAKTGKIWTSIQLKMSNELGQVGENGLRGDSQRLFEM